MQDKCMECEKDMVLKYSDLQKEYTELENYCELLEKCLDTKELLNKTLRDKNDELKNKLRNYEV